MAYIRQPRPDSGADLVLLAALDPAPKLIIEVERVLLPQVHLLKRNYFTGMCSGSVAGSYSRLIDFCITCESNKEEEESTCLSPPNAPKSFLNSPGFCSPPSSPPSCLPACARTCRV